jgi:hypothetical protein
MPNWVFEPLPPALVEQEPTQRDQFNNDEVGLSDALVREVVQNSTDAPNDDGPVKVRFALVELDDARSAELRLLMDSLRPHLAASEVDQGPIDEVQAKLLVIEDFNTTGLTGAVDELDNGNFRNFWRRHGKSVKTGGLLGRWGLGKLVFSSSSRIHAFFGLTCRDKEPDALLLGQAVLLNHTINGKRYPAHGFWFSDRSESGLQLPVVDPAIVTKFEELGELERGHSSGLSVIVPYPVRSITEESLIAGVINNYYFPILAGRLEVEVGSTVIDRNTFLEVASGVNSGVPFGFVSEVSQAMLAGPGIVLPGTLPDAGLTEACIPSETVVALRQEFVTGSLVHVRVPIQLTPRGSPPIDSFVDLFLQMPGEHGESYALFVRRSLSISGERRSFAGVPAYGALIASDPTIVAFLGDAENPAHTSWNSNAEKLEANWQRPTVAMKLIRAALRELYQIVGQEVQQTHENALRDFFSIVDAIPTRGRKKKRTASSMLEINSKERGITIQHRKGGFSLSGGPASAKWTYPKVIRVRTAYDLIGGNPFKRHSNYDFDVRSEIEFEVKEAEVEGLSSNVIRVRALGPDFHVAATGFDENRDLVVEARTAS